MDNRRKSKTINELRKSYYPFIIRSNGQDEGVFQNVFLTKNYDFGPLNFKPLTIIDNGCFVGYSTVYFNRIYPNARIASIEPIDSNFSTLQKNTQYISLVTRFTNCLLNQNSKVVIVDKRYKNQGFEIEKVGDENESELYSITVNDILGEKNWNQIDIFKTDLNGSGIDLFIKNFEDWVPKVKIFLLEFASTLDPEKLKIFLNAIKDIKFRKSQCGTSLVFIKEEEIVEELGDKEV